MSIESFVFRMPKVELHVHLEGCLRAASLLSLSKKNGVPLPAEDEAGVRQWFRAARREQIQQICCRALRDPEDFHLLTLDFLAEQAMQNVLYSEVHFSVSVHAANGVDTKAVLPAIQEAAEQGERRHGIKMRLIPEIMRDAGAKAADQTLEWALAGKDTLSVALGLSDAENADVSPFREHFESAAREGLHRVAHAGTPRGPDSIREVLEICGAERIGHGVGAIEDGNLSAELSEKGVSVEFCPTDGSTHSVEQLQDKGIRVSINSDRPQLLQTNLTREYVRLHRTLGYVEGPLAELAMAGIGHTFLTEQGRRDVEDEFHRRLDGLRSSRSER